MSHKKYFTLSFDDGIEQDKKLIELLKQYGLPCTFNLNGGLLGEKNYVAYAGEIGFMNLPPQAKIRRSLFKTVNQYRIPADEIAQVYAGFEIAAHAFMHEPFKGASAEKINESLDKDREVLSRLTNQPITGFAYPGGFSSEIAGKCLVEKGFLFGREAFTSDSFAWPADPFRYKPTCSHKSKNVFELIDKFLDAEAENEDLLFMMWGHSYEFDYGTENSSLEHMERVFEKISGRSDIVYCTNSFAFADHAKNKHP